MTIRKAMLILVTAVFVAFPLTAVGADSEEAKYPNKPLEFVAQGAGASMDILGRVIIDIIEREKMLGQPISVNNKGGAGGSNQMAYVLGKGGTPYVFFGTSTNLLIGTPMLQKLPYSYKNFVPIVNMSFDGSLLYVRSDSPFHTVNELIEAAGKKPKSLVMATSSVTSGESMTGRRLQNDKRVEWNIAYFKGDANVMTNVLGGHVDFAIGNPSFVYEHIRAGKIRALMAVSTKRFDKPELKEVPCIEELGLGEALVARRAFLGPPNMPGFAVKKLEGVFKKVSEHPLWIKFLEDNMQISEYMDSKTLGAWLQKEEPKFRQRLIDAGLLK